MAEKDLNQTQFGTESTWGTVVTGTAKIMGVEECTLKPGVKAKVISEERASLAPGYQAYLSEVNAEGSIKGAAMYEDICYLLDNLFGSATPGGAGPYTRDYTAPIGTVPAPRKLSVIHGITGEVQTLGGALVQDLTIKGEYGGTVEYEASLIGKQVVDGALAALADRVVHPILAQEGGLTIDPWGGTIGTTAVPAAWYSFEAKFESDRGIKKYLGALPGGGYRQPKWKGSLKVSLEFNTTQVNAWLTSALGLTTPLQQQMQLKFMNGTDYLFELGFCGLLEETPELYKDEDGVNSLDFEWIGLYQATFANWAKINTKNMLATLP